MRLLTLGLLIFSMNAMACWKMQATLSVNEHKVEINQKIDHDKTYSFNSGDYIFHVKIPSHFEAPAQMKNKNDAHMVEMNVQQKKGITLTDVSEGKVIVLTGKEATMTKQDNQTGELTTLVVKLTEI